MLLVLIALIILAWLAIQTTPVQNWLVRQVTHKLSKNLHATVSINHVDFALFNKMLLEGTLVKNTLRFGSDQAAGWALWEAAGQLTITADIYVNGVKVQGCTPRYGKITGRIDLDTN